MFGFIFILSYICIIYLRSGRLIYLFSFICTFDNTIFLYWIKKVIFRLIYHFNNNLLVDGFGGNISYQLTKDYRFHLRCFVCHLGFLVSIVLTLKLCVHWWKNLFYFIHFFYIYFMVEFISILSCIWFIDYFYFLVSVTFILILCVK